MDFVGGLVRNMKGHDYIFMVVDRFSKMCIIMSCTKIIKGEKRKNLFFEKVLVHFGYQ